MIRVFPRRTKWTPDDDLAFVGYPPLFLPPEQPVRVSCTFTWDMDEAERLAEAWSQCYPDVLLGGPAYEDPGGEFVPGRFVKQGVTITSRGCPRRCGFCFVPEREGKLRELPIMDGWNVADNNLLACSDAHVSAVFDMLSRQPHAATFSGGLDTRLLKEWQAKRLMSMRVKFMFFACDSAEGIRPLAKVGTMLSDMSIEKKRCYVLIGYNGEQIEDAEYRLKRVYELGFLPFAMLYKSDPPKQWGAEWRALQRYWARPAMYRGTK